MLSPGLAAAIVSRREPVPLSAAEVTVMVAARIDDGMTNPNIAKTVRNPFMTTPSRYGAPQHCWLRIASPAELAASSYLLDEHAILAGRHNRPAIEGIG